MRQGVGLLLVYSLGLGIPFILAALAIKPFMRAMQRFRGHLAAVEKVLGGFLVLTGILFLTNSMTLIAGLDARSCFPALPRSAESACSPFRVAADSDGHDRDRSHHRRLRFLRRRRHPGRPQDLLRARRLWRERDHRADRAEHPRRRGRARRAAGLRAARRSRRSRATSRSAPSRSACWRRAGSSRPSPKGSNAFPGVPVVLDPVMVAASRRCPCSTRTPSRRCAPCSCRARALITPNLPEAAQAARCKLGAGPRPRWSAQARGASARWARTPCWSRAATPKATKAVDILIDATGRAALRGAARRRPRNTHGTGCTLSSAIAAELAKGASLREAVSAAKAYVTAAHRSGGRARHRQGQGPRASFPRALAEREVTTASSRPRPCSAARRGPRRSARAHRRASGTRADCAPCRRRAACPW